MTHNCNILELGSSKDSMLSSDASKGVSAVNHALTAEITALEPSSSSPRNEQQYQDVVDDMDDEDDDDESDIKDDSTGQKPANPERLKAFNMFMRLFIDENLDRLVPISKQPKEKINAIIMSCQRQFPEFSERARKRIRTYLKSCRRSTRLREPATKPLMTHIPASQLTEVNNILAQACQNETHEVAKRQRLETCEVISSAFNAKNVESQSNKHFKASEHQKGAAGTSHIPRDSTHPSLVASNLKAPLMKLSKSEMKSMRNLVDGYRQSASFLHRSADELEKLLKQCEAYSEEVKDGESTSQDELDDKQEKEDQCVDPKSVIIKNEPLGDKTLKVVDHKSEYIDVSSVFPICSNVTTSFSPNNSNTDLVLRPIDLGSNIIKLKHSLLQPVPELLPLRLCETSQPVEKNYFSPVSFPLSVERIHATTNYSMCTPVNHETSTTLYPIHLHKQNDNPGTSFQTYTHKHNEIPIAQYQTHVHKQENPVSQYPLHGHKQMLIRRATVIPISNHLSPQSTAIHLSPQQRKTSQQQSPRSTTMVSRILSMQSNSPSSSTMYAFRQNQPPNQSNCPQAKQSNLLPDSIHYSSSHQGTLNLDNSSQVLDIRPEIMTQRLSPHVMNYHSVLSTVTSPHIQEESRLAHIHDINHQPHL